MKVKSESEVAQLCPTPSNPVDCSLPGFFVHGIFQARVLEWGATAFSDTHIHTHSYICVYIYICDYFFLIVIIKTALDIPL